MANFNNMAALKSALQRDIKQTLSHAMEASFAITKQDIQHFYDSPEPKVYIRTGLYGASPTYDGIYGSGGHYLSSIYLDTNTPYLTSNLSTETIFSAIQCKGMGIIGNPGTWDRAVKDIKDTVNKTFASKYH